jgi:hypothetical protein
MSGGTNSGARPLRRPAPLCFIPYCPPFSGDRRTVYASAAPRDFVRIHVCSSGAVLLQTKVTKYVSMNREAALSSVDLYSVVHVADEAYFEDLNRDLAYPYDAVYFELITAKVNLAMDPFSRQMSLVREISPSSRALAQAMNLAAVPQVGKLDVSKGWIADLSAEEIADIENKVGDRKSTFSGDEDGMKRTFFRGARILLLSGLCILPCPELHVLLLDAAESDFRHYLLPLYIFALIRGDITSARRLKFAQSIQANTMRRANTQVVDAVTAARNQHAVRSLVDGAATSNFKSVAIVYGAWHCDNLGRLIENELGLEYKSSHWKTAMVAEAALTARFWSKFWASVSIQSEGMDGAERHARFPVMAGGVLFILFAGVEIVAAIDWSHAITTIALAWEHVWDASRNDQVLELCAYGIRHGAVYYFLRRWFKVEDE